MIEKRKTLVRDPAKEFVEPQRLLEREDIAPTDKLLLLQDWQADLLELQRATEENMPRDGGMAGEAADQLARVNEAISFVRNDLALTK